MTEPPPPAANYQAPAEAVPYSGALVPPTNTLAIVALILGFVLPPGGIICGHLALSQIKRTGESGHGLAMAGTVMGYVFTGLAVLAVIAYVLFFVVLFSTIWGTVGMIPGVYS